MAAAMGGEAELVGALMERRSSGSKWESRVADELSREWEWMGRKNYFFFTFYEKNRLMGSVKHGGDQGLTCCVGALVAVRLPLAVC